MNRRSTHKPCPCGSGLIGLRNITTFTGQHIVCAKCRITVPTKKCVVVINPRAKADAQARRRIEEMRDAREVT